MKFTTMAYADISTGYLEKKDLPLLSSFDGQGHVAKLDGGYGEIFVVDSDPETFVEHIAAWREHGFSDRFIAIMQELLAQGIPYARFDADGGEIEGIELASGNDDDDDDDDEADEEEGKDWDDCPHGKRPGFSFEQVTKGDE